MEPRNKVFLDTDVILDHLADRQPFAEHAHRIFALAETGELTVCVSSLSFSNLYYILRKIRGGPDALDLLRKMKLLVRVTSVGEPEVRLALGSSFTDFEDAMQHFSAKAETGISAMITRNKTDYAASAVTVLSPETFLENFELTRRK